MSKNINVALYPIRPTEQKFRGSDATGGGTILTLSNIKLSKSENVYLNGVRQTGAGVDYTASHLAASSTITFVAALDPVDYISVVYFS